MEIRSGTVRRFKDETGKTYGKLTVLRFDEMRNDQPYFACQCECGRRVSVRGANLRSRNTTSCGCSRRTRLRGKMVGQTFGCVFVFGKADQRSKKWVTGCQFCPLFGFHTEGKLRRGRGLLCECQRRTYTSWRKMIDRCTNKNHPQYKDYGGRGIGVCKRWLGRFSDFLHDMGPRPEGKTLDRINNDEGYCKKNCRWATKQQQAATRRKRGKS
jgi:hypothetical protein